MSDEHLRILIVEDEPLIRWSVSETLAREGHSVMEAASAAAAVDAIRAVDGDIDVVLMDYRLPDSDDLRLLSRIRRLQPHSAVVMMTAESTPEVTENALALGAYRVIGKPFDMHDLEPLVVEAHRASHNHH